MSKLPVLLFVVLVVLGGCVGENPIGGQTDEHGCLGPAGYTYNETIGACVREWELDESQARAAMIAIDYLEPVKGATITNVDVLRCPGCFIVSVKLHLNSGDKDVQVNILDWSVTSSDTS